MFFNRQKQQAEASAHTGLTDGIEAKVAEFVKDWGDLKRGRRSFVADGTEPPLQLLTDADTAHFVTAMEAEAARIEAEIADQIEDQRKRHLAEIAQKDAQIAAINREIEAQKARVAVQSDELDRRANARAGLLATATKIDPSLDASKILKDANIRREVVRRKFGDSAVDGRSEAYVDERFEALEARANVDPFARVVADGLLSTAQDGRQAAEEAYNEMCRNLKDGWKTH